MNFDKLNVFAQLPNFAFCKDLHSTYFQCNSNLAKIAGLESPNDIIGKNDYKLPWAEQADLYVRGDQEILDTSMIVEFVEPLPLSTGETIKIVIQKGPLFNLKGQKIGIIGNFSEYVDNKYDGRSQRGGKNMLSPHTRHAYGPLTKKQSECLFYLIRGKSSKEISLLLKKSKRTIEDHINNLKDQFNCQTKSELIDKVFELGYAHVLPPSLIEHYHK